MDITATKESSTNMKGVICVNAVIEGFLTYKLSNTANSNCRLMTIDMSNPKRTFASQIGCFAILLILSPMLYADQTSIIGARVMQGAGRAAINQAAGNHNIQSNTHAIGPRTSIKIHQSNINRSSLLSAEEFKVEDDEHFSAIESLAFANFQGLASVNQVSGQNNIQSNLGSIAFDSTTELGLSDKDLTKISSQSAPQFQTAQYHVDLAQDSFQEAQGVIQINQISGNNNVAVNQFSLQLPREN